MKSWKRGYHKATQDCISHQKLKKSINRVCKAKMEQ